MRQRRERKKNVDIDHAHISFSSYETSPEGEIRMHWQLSKKPFPSRLGVNFPAAVISRKDWKLAEIFFSCAHVSLVAHWRAGVCVNTRWVDKLQSGFVDTKHQESRAINFPVISQSLTPFSFSFVICCSTANKLNDVQAFFNLCKLPTSLTDP